jgi:hypothetical protein
MVGKIGTIVDRNRGIDVCNFASSVAGCAPGLLDIIWIGRVRNDIDLAHRTPRRDAANIMNRVLDIPRIDRLGKCSIYNIGAPALRDELNPSFKGGDLVSGTSASI